MSLKNLNLNKESIEDTIKSFPNYLKLNKDVKPNLDVYTVNVSGHKNPAILSVFHKTDGRITLSSSGGKNTSLGEEIALFIKKQCEKKDPAVAGLYLKKLPSKDFDTLIEYLISKGCIIGEEKAIFSGIQRKVTSLYGDNVSLNLYSSGSFYVQGSGINVKSYIIDGLSNELSYRDLIAMQLEELKVDLPIDQALEMLQHIMPEAYGYLGDRLIAIICPSVTLQKIDVDLADYTSFVFPALRGLEGFIKKVFLDNNILIDVNFGERFEEREDGKFVLNSVAKGIISNSAAETLLTECYNYYKKNRHGLFHADGIPDNSRIIEEKAIAQEIIRDVFNLIEGSYRNMKNNGKQ